jgi:hypothetical protein
MLITGEREASLTGDVFDDGVRVTAREQDATGSVQAVHVIVS